MLKRGMLKRELLQLIRLVLIACLFAGCYSEPYEKEDMQYFEDEMDADDLALDEFDDDFDIRAQEIEARNAPPGTKTVFAISPDVGPWTGSAKVGQSQVFDDSSNNRQTIIKTGELGAPAVRNVSLWMDYDRWSPDLDAVSGVENFDVKADVIVGLGGTAQQFQVDWHNGTTFSLPFNSLEVTAIYAGIPSGVIPFKVPADLVLSAAVGEGSAGWPNATYTQKGANGANNHSVAIQIPQFAKMVTFHNLPDMSAHAGVVYVYFYADHLAQILVGLEMLTERIFSNHDAMIDGFPIPAGARALRIYDSVDATPGIYARFVLDF